jgi:hypothetical protein
MFGLPSWWAIYGALDHAVRTGLPATEKVLSSGFYASFAEHPEESAVFNAAMVAKAHGQVAGILATSAHPAGIRDAVPQRRLFLPT